MNTARGQLGGAGPVYTAVIAAGGGTPSASNAVEQWDGTNWTEIAEINSSRKMFHLVELQLQLY